MFVLHRAFHCLDSNDLCDTPVLPRLAPETMCMYTNLSFGNKLHSSAEHRGAQYGAGGRFLMAYQIIALLALYLLITAVVDQSATIALAHQTRLLLSLGADPLSFSCLMSLSTLLRIALSVCVCMMCWRVFLD